jgi:hypothetical protein
MSWTGAKVEPLYSPRFVSKDQLAELVNLYHLARTALSGGPCGRWERMNWAANEFHKKYPAIGATAAYKDLSAQLENS